MPIIQIEVVTDKLLPPGLANRLADSLGDVFDSEPGGTWVRLHALPHAHYAENDIASDATPQPVFVMVLKSRNPSPDEMRQEAERIAQAVGELCERPRANVHVLYETAASGRIAFGGELMVG